MQAYTRDAKAVDSLFLDAGIELRHAPLQGFVDFTSLMALRADMASMPQNAIIHAHRYRDAFMTLVARRLASRPDIKVVATRHIVRRGRDSLLYRRMYRNLDAQIFVSEAARERFLTAWRGHRLPFAREKMHTLYNSLNIPDRQRKPEPEKGPVIAMFHGRLRPGKGLETLIDALPRLKGLRTRLRLVGTGDPDYVDRLRSRAAARGVMEMIDWCKYTADPMPLIRECHFGVLPSTAREAFGLANIEYMANGRPQICTDNGAQSEYMASGREALFIPAADTQSLGDALLRLATDPALRASMGTEALATYRRSLAWPIFIDRLTDIYTGMLPD